MTKCSILFHIIRIRRTHSILFLSFFSPYDATLIKLFDFWLLTAISFVNHVLIFLSFFSHIILHWLSFCFFIFLVKLILLHKLVFSYTVFGRRERDIRKERLKVMENIKEKEEYDNLGSIWLEEIDKGMKWNGINSTYSIIWFYLLTMEKSFLWNN
ncbi:hypothetical protein TorRG33x02_072810, partial [Trema orientale]